MRVVQVFRKKNPRFFSIESVFERVNTQLGGIGIVIVTLKDFGVSVLNILELLKLRILHRGAVFHVTGDVHYSVLLLPRSRTILTIHDCVFMHNSSGIKGFLIKSLYLRMPVRWCKYITTISNKTKWEIIEFTKSSESKVTVIPNPISEQIKCVEKDFKSSCPEILFIGVTSNKNLGRVSRALRNLVCRLVIIGKPDSETIDQLHESKLDFVIRHSLSNDEMAKVYAESDIILFPSLYEGFGLPIIEGFQAGRVVVTSDLSPMRDIAEGAACLIDPYSIESIRSGVMRVIQDKMYREILINRGFTISEKYKASVIASYYLDIYKRVYKDICAE